MAEIIVKYKEDTDRMKVKGGGHTSVGIVYCGNYAAMKDNMLHNTLLKAVR